MNPLIEYLPIETEYISTYFSMDYHATRSKGVHLMEIVSDLELRLGRRKTSSPEFAESLDRFAVMGFVYEHEISRALEVVQRFPHTDDRNVVSMWEFLLSRRMTEIDVERRPDLLFKPSEQVMEGVFLTPDGACKKPRRAEEFKLTWGGLVTDPEQFAEKYWRWLVQGACYTRALGVGEACYRVYHVNGAYEKGKMGAPKLAGWRVRFSDDDQEEVWEMVLNHKETMVREGKLPKVVAA